MKDNQDIPFVIWLEDRDGGSVRCDAYDTAEELLKDWPHAVKISAREYEAYIGGGR